jgi:hypothetical protein
VFVKKPAQYFNYTKLLICPFSQGMVVMIGCQQAAQAADNTDQTSEKTPSIAIDTA